MHNEYTQASKLSGEPIHRTALIGLIVRSYAHSGIGCWFFQNGPQHVFVELDCMPWVARLSAGDAPRASMTATGATFSPSGCFLDE